MGNWNADAREVMRRLTNRYILTADHGYKIAVCMNGMSPPPQTHVSPIHYCASSLLFSPVTLNAPNHYKLTEQTLAIRPISNPPP